MVEELRKIILSSEEVLLALEGYRRVTPGFLPPGKILSWKASTETSLVVEVEAQDPLLRQPNQEASLKAADLFEPTVKFCISNNIMLPRDSRKCIRIERDRVALYIIIGNPEGASVCPV